MDRPLSDLTVLDLTRALSGPLAGRLLADLGAEVIKVEPPAGDLTRTMVPRIQQMSVYYVQCNAGKRCVSLDLTRPQGREVFLRMVERADIVLENFRPDVMGRLGLSHDELAARNPAVVLVSISGWGHGNSRSSQGAFASTIHAETGLTAAVAAARGDDPPRNDPPSHADVYGGLHALAAVLAAVHVRDRTGRGQAVEVSMAESTLVANDLASVELSGLEPDEGFRGGQHRTPIYRLATGRAVCVTVDPTTTGGFGVWWRAMGRPELADDPRFATAIDRTNNRAGLDAELARWVAGFDTAVDLERALGTSAVLAAEVRTVAELAATPWAAERGAFVEVEVGDGPAVQVPQSPWRFSQADAGVVPVVGFRGEHNRAVLAELAGLDDEELDALEADGVVSQRVPDRPR
jgi:CoA:oxalate CoA-transferase